MDYSARAGSVDGGNELSEGTGEAADGHVLTDEELTSQHAIHESLIEAELLGEHITGFPAVNAAASLKPEKIEKAAEGLSHLKGAKDLAAEFFFSPQTRHVLENFEIVFLQGAAQAGWWYL